MPLSPHSPTSAIKARALLFQDAAWRRTTLPQKKSKSSVCSCVIQDPNPCWGGSGWTAEQKCKGSLPQSQHTFGVDQSCINKAEHITDQSSASNVKHRASCPLRIQESMAWAKLHPTELPPSRSWLSLHSGDVNVKTKRKLTWAKGLFATHLWI